MKRFDFAGEVAKQLITISSAIITVVIAFYEKFFSHSQATFYAVLFTLLIFIFSIGSGVLSLGGVVNLVETQEYDDYRRSTGAIPAPTFTRLAGSWAQWFAARQQLFFAIGLLLFILVAYADRAHWVGFGAETTVPSSPQGQSAKPN